MRLIDADLMIVNGFENKTIEVRTEDIIEKHEKVVKLLFKDTLEFIKKQPTVDAVKVVRCKDCKNWIQFADEAYATCDCGHGRTNKRFYCMDGDRSNERVQMGI